MERGGDIGRDAEEKGLFENGGRLDEAFVLVAGNALYRICRQVKWPPFCLHSRSAPGKYR